MPMQIVKNIEIMKRWILLLSMCVPLAGHRIGAQTTIPQPSASQAVAADTVLLQLFHDSIGLAEVVVKGKRTPVANSRWSDMHPVELVTVGGANGDLYRALQTLPGTQVQGESGRLLVRGGSSSETQTYMDGMHVLNPYTATGINSPARGRYSTFMFSGVSLESGGAPLEYGQALSAVLPLETKDRSPVNKLGVNASTVGLGGGGTRAFGRGSLSVNLDFQDLCVYDRIYSGRTDFKDPYRLLTVSAQFRYHPDEATLFKIYFGYDRTDFSNYEGEMHADDTGYASSTDEKASSADERGCPDQAGQLRSDDAVQASSADKGQAQARRLFGLGEDNIYVNATFRKSVSGGWNWFAGAAYGFTEQKISGVSLSGDAWMERRQELHLKAKACKRLASAFRLDMGLESFVRRYVNRYQMPDAGAPDVRRRMNPTVGAAFVSATCYPVEQLKAELSFRTEYTSPNRQATFSPRFSVNYYLGDVVFSATAGRWTQLPTDKLLVQDGSLRSESCVQYNLGVRLGGEERFCKAEAYYKRYDRLAWIGQGTMGWAEWLSSDGYGHSKGIDLFYDDCALVRNLEYRISYTYNLSRRKYQDYPELTVPQYATRHNASVVLKYSLPRLRTVVGLTERFSSGRPYHNPALPGLMNDEAKPYNSLDLGLTFLPSKKVILHASATNILCRKNEFGKVEGMPIRASSDHFFYLGVFVTIGKKVAYDVSNF